MAKKINEDAVTIKRLLKKGFSQKKICQLLGLKKQKVSYWANHEIKTTQIRRKKLPKSYIAQICKMAQDKTTSDMGSKKIAYIINDRLIKNNVLDSKGKNLSVSFKTICRYLNEGLGTPRKIRKSFFLTKKQMEERLNFCKNILSKGLSIKDIMFTDETKIELGNYTNDSIRLSPKTREKLRKGEKEAYELINRPERKFEKSLMVAGGITYNGLTKLIILDGTLNEFSYGQGLLFYKDDINNFNTKYNTNIYFEQDGAPAHRCKANKHLLNKLFPNGHWIQNPPNSPDLAYPIENLWGIIKPRVKRRNPETIEDLKRFLLEEWNSVPLKMVQSLCEGYFNRLKKCVELNGGRIEPEHIKKSHSKIYDWEKPEELPTVRVIYNDYQLKLHQKREIKRLKKEIKEIEKSFAKKIKENKNNKKKYKKKDLKYMSIGRALSIIQGPERLTKERDEKIREIKLKINKICKMNLKEYIKHKNGRDKDENDDEDTVMDEIEKKINQLEEICKKSKIIKYSKCF